MTPKLKMTQQRKQNAPTQWLNKTQAFTWLCQELLPGICLSCIKFQGKVKLGFWSIFQQIFFFLLTYEGISQCESSSIPMVKIFSSTLNKNTVLLWDIFIAIHYCLE